MDEGNAVHRKARELFPEAVSFESVPDEARTLAVADAIGDQKIKTLAELPFSVGPYAARADFLQRARGGWEVIEVKASLNDKAEFIDDMAYTGLVLHKAGLRVTRATLLLMSRSFRLGMGPQDLFLATDHTGEVLERAIQFDQEWDGVVEVIESPLLPEPDVQFECRQCPVIDQCIAEGIDNPIFDLPRLREKKFKSLCEMGILSIEDIPNGFALTDNQRHVVEGVRASRAVVFGDLRRELEAVSWPAFYLDFETVLTALPLYPDVGPYEQIPTIFSVHKCSEPGCVASEHQFIADQSRDGRRDLAEHLIAALESEGSILVYSGFERRIINSLAEIFPDLAEPLSALSERLFDLEQVIKKCLYHPAFHGRTSIKATLPALIDDMSYEGLHFQNGSDAMAAFARLAWGEYGDGEEAQVVRDDLVKYCAQDTLAMVRLHHKLYDYLSDGPEGVA